MAKKIEMLNDQQEVVHPLTSSDCVIMENGKTLEEVMGDGIATPTVTHEGASFQVGVGDSNIEVVDGDVAGMTLEGQTYQNILPKPTTLILETDEKEFKINDKIDNNIVLDDNVAEIATIKGQTYVNAVQEESASEYTVLGEDLSGQSITTTGKPEGYVKNATLEGLTLVNTIQEPSGADVTVLDLDADINAQRATTDNTVQGGIHGATLKGQTLVNLIDTENGYGMRFQYDGTVDGDCYTVTTMSHGQKVVVNQAPSSWRYFGQEIKLQMLKPSTKYFVSGEFQGISTFQFMQTNGLKPISIDGDVINNRYAIIETAGDLYGNITSQCLYGHISSNIDSGSVLMCNDVILVEYQEGMENWDIPYFEGMKSVEVPSVKTTGKNLFDGEMVQGYIGDANGALNADNTSGISSANFTQVKPNTTYKLTLSSNPSNGTIRFYFYDRYKNYIGYSTDISTIFTTGNNVGYVKFRIHKIGGVFLSDYENVQFHIEEGSTATSYEPYKSSTTKVGLLPLLETEKSCYYSSSTGAKLTSNPNVNSVKYKVQGLSKVYVKVAHSNFTFWGSNDTYISGQPTITGGDNSEGYLDVPSNAVYMRCAVDNTKIAEVYEAVVLRKVRDVQDELDLETGKLTQRIGEIVLDGVKNKMSHNSNFNSDTHMTFSIGVKMATGNTTLLNCDKLPVKNAYTSENFEGVIKNNAGNQLAIRLEKSKIETYGSINSYLQQNPITVQYVLESPITRQVDLSIVDQDNKSIKTIQTHPTLTHISTSSQGLIPNIVIPSQLKYPTIIKPSTTYTVQLKQTTINSEFPLTINLGGTVMAVPSTKFTITTPETLTSQDAIFTGKNNVIGEVVITEGDTTGIEYDYFEGMNDVKSPSMYATGKNLFDGKIESGGLDWGTGKQIVNTNQIRTISFINVMPNETYTLTKPEYVGGMFLYDKNKNHISTSWISDSRNITVTTSDNAFFLKLILNTSDTNIDIQIEQGFVATSYEPYKGVTIEQDVDSIPLTSSMFEQGGWVTDPLIIGMSMQQVVQSNNNSSRIRSKSLIPVKPNCKYILNGGLTGWGLGYDKNGGYVATINNIEAFTTTSNTYYITPVLRISDNSNITPSTLDSLNLTLQEVTDEIVLRSLPNGVKDTLNLTTGEYVQRVGEVVLDGSESWNKDTTSGGTKDNTAIFFTETNFNGFKPSPNVDYRDTMMLCDKFPIKARVYNLDEEGMMINQDGRIYIRINQSRLETVDMNGFKKFLLGNNVKVECELATPIIKKVNLTNTTKLPSYTSTTHYDAIVPSNSLVPNIKIPSTIDYNVAIKPSTQYTIRANTTSSMSVDLGGSTGTLANGKVTLTTPSTLAHNSLKLGNGKVKEVMVIEGSEIKDNVPFFNGMKNVQMGGIKLVNIARLEKYSQLLVTANANKTQFTYTPNQTSWGHVVFDNSLLKPNTTYTVLINVIKNDLQPVAENILKIQFRNTLSRNSLYIKKGFTGLYKALITTVNENEFDSKDFGLFFVDTVSDSSKQMTIQNPMVIEGDWTHLDDIPFIESEMIIEQPIIRSQGKNLFLPFNNWEQNNINGITITSTSINGTPSHGGFAMLQKIYLDKDKEYWLSYSTRTGNSCRIRLRKINSSQDVVIANIFTNSTNGSLRVSETGYYYLTIENNGNTTDSIEISNLQLEEGATATTYEPFKQHILSSNRVIGYEEGCYHDYRDGTKQANTDYNSMLADVEGLPIAYVTHASSNFAFYDKDMVFISGKAFLDTSLSAGDKNGFIAVPSNAKYMKFASANRTSWATDYTKATVTGDLPLRSLPNGVCDTLNLVTGEYVQRVGEVVLDGTNLAKLINFYDHSKFSGASGYSVQVAMGDMATFNSYGTASTIVWCDKLKNLSHEVIDRTTQSGITTTVLNSTKLLLIKLPYDFDGSPSLDTFKQYISKNPVTVQYELATPIVRKIGLTAKGTYRETKLNGSENWISANADANNTICTRYYLPNGTSVNSVAPNMIVNSPTFSDYIKSRKYPSDSHGQYEYVSVINEGLYLQIYKNKLLQDSVSGFKQWLSQHPVKVGYLTNQSNTTYSNILKPIFFNNVKVQFMNDNVDIQPTLTLQSRSRNSYVMDMMNANTRYTLKALANPNSFTIDGTSYNATTNGTFTSPSTLTNKLLVTGQDVQELMIIEGDVTGKTIPYYKGIRSVYDDVNRIEVLSQNKNLFDINAPFTKDGAWSTVIEGNSIISTRINDNVNGAFGAGFRINHIKPNTVYTLSWSSGQGHIYVYNNSGLWGTGLSAKNTNEGNSLTFTTNSDTKYITIGFNYGQYNIGTVLTTSNVQLEEALVASSYQSHKHNTTIIDMPSRWETIEVVRPNMEMGAIDNTNGQECVSANGTEKRLPFTPVLPKEILMFRNGTSYRAMNVHFYDINKNFIKYQYTNGTGDLVVPESCYFIRGFCRMTDTHDLTITKQAYKPIALNSLPNGVKDEIIIDPVSNKAKLIQRVGKVVFDGQDVWGTYTVHDNNVRIQTTLSNCVNRDTASQVYSVCDKLPSVPWNYSWLQDYNLITVNVTNVHLQLADTSLTKQQMLDWLKQNPLTVYYELATPIIHEIHLTGFPFVYEDGSVQLNTELPHKTLVDYNVNQEQLINNQNETIIRHDKQIDSLYDYIELYLEEEYRMELFRMQLELSL